MHRVPARYGLSRLDRATGRVIRRYERDQPGESVHVAIGKLGDIPDGGGHKVLGRAAGRKSRANTGYGYLHTASTTTPAWPTAKSCPTGTRGPPQVLNPGQAFSTQAEITIERMPARIAHKRTRAHRPQTGSEVERFRRTLPDE